MQLDSLRKLYVHQLKDLYSAEGQAIDALPRLAEAASDERLASAIKHHTEQTRTHRERIETIFESLDFEPGGVHCGGAEGLIKEATDLLKEKITPEVLDAGLIAALQRFEHYEISGYGTARAYAEKLGDHAAADLLTKTLEEESKANDDLGRLAERSLNFEAMELAG